MKVSYCTGCRDFKSVHRFHKDSYAPHQIRRRCKSCVSRSKMMYRWKKEYLRG